VIHRLVGRAGGLMAAGWETRTLTRPSAVVPDGGGVGGLTGSLTPVVTARARWAPLPAGSACSHRVPAAPVPAGRGRLRRSGPPRSGTGSAGRARQDRSSPRVWRAGEAVAGEVTRLVRVRRLGSGRGPGVRDCPYMTTGARLSGMWRVRIVGDFSPGHLGGLAICLSGCGCLLASKA